MKAIACYTPLQQKTASVNATDVTEYADLGKVNTEYCHTTQVSH